MFYTLVKTFESNQHHKKEEEKVVSTVRKTLPWQMQLNMVTASYSNLFTVYKQTPTNIIYDTLFQWK